MSTLENTHVLIVEDEADLRSAIADVLEDEGAEVTQVGSVEAALLAVTERAPEVMVVDLHLPDDDGNAFLIRAREAGIIAPAIAISALGAGSAVVREAQKQFQKLLRKPFDIGDLIVSVASLATCPDQRMNLREALRRSNDATGYRFTSLFRFDGEELTSVWSYDRENPQADGFPIDMEVEGSYCRYVRATNQPFLVEDAGKDPRVEKHPKREVLRAYCGVPVRDEAGETVGSLCHFDAVPKALDPAAVAALEREAERIEEEVFAKGARRSRIG